jgi:hypothetical protein
MHSNPSPRDVNAFPTDFRGIRISLASPDTIRNWSHGEVTKAETINYRSYKPDPEAAREVFEGSSIPGGSRPGSW